MNFYTTGHSVYKSYVEPEELEETLKKLESKRFQVLSVNESEKMVSIVYRKYITFRMWDTI